MRRTMSAPVRRTMSALLGTGLVLVLSSCSLLPGHAKPAAQIRADYDAALWAQRPVVDLDLTVDPDLASVTGREAVDFTPDQRVCELAFRAWPNNPTMAATGSSLVVTAAEVAGRPVTPRVSAAGAPAGAPGTLVQLPLADCVDAGRTVHAELGFTLRLGEGDERVGHSVAGGTAWFGSGYPLLAWVRGQGWVRDTAVEMNGETATSEVFDLRSLRVTAPEGAQVVGVGTERPATPGPTPGTTTHRFSAPAVRDVTVAVGAYTVTTHDVHDVRVHLALPQRGSRAPVHEWVRRIDESIGTLSDDLGPFPYADLWVAITPGQTDGTEFPGALQFGDQRSQGLAALVAHEVAHQWFYALVGNDQARDPWLDESFAAFSEGLVLGRGGEYDADDLPDRVVGEMGRPMSYWAGHGGLDAYDAGVYRQGAAVLTAARAEVGDEDFDADLRAYLTANAHRVATPADLAAAFADRPTVLARLREAGALPAQR